MSILKKIKIKFKDTVAEPKEASVEMESEIPEQGTAGQVLTKTENGVAFADIPSQVPTLPTENGSYKLTIANGVATWELIA